MIIKRGKRYGVRVYIAGRQEWVGTYAKIGEAREAERNAQVRRHPRASETCGSFARRWVDDYPRGAAATKRTYRYALKRFARDFDKLRLDDVDRPTAREWALRQPKANVWVVRSMFSDGVRDGLCTMNPFADLRLDHSRGRKDLVALTESELHELAGCARDVHGDYGSTFAAMIVFAGYVGLRPAELFALDYGDITADRVHIRQSLDATGQLKLPKNGRARMVVLPPPARDALRSMPRRVDTPLAFTTKRGKRLHKAGA